MAEGGITCVVGPNGAGKSTLMASVSGLLRPRLGLIALDGKNLVGMSPRQVLRLGVVENGRVRLSGTGREVLENPEIGALYLGGAVGAS